MIDATTEVSEETAVARTDGAPLRKVIIARRPGFRAGISFRFAGQQLELMTEKDAEALRAGDFEPEPVSEPVDVDLIVPPLNFSQLQEMKSHINMLNANPDLLSFAALVEILRAALSRNYRGVPRWLIEQTIDVGNMADLVQAVMDVSGMKRKEIEEAKKAMAANSAGTTSTATSRQ